MAEEKITVEIDGNNKVKVFRERPATKAEQKADPGAKYMSEVVNIYFGLRPPKVVVNCDLCGD